MRHPTFAISLSLATTVLIGCADPSQATAPTGMAMANHSEHAQSATIRVVMTDNCDAPSFNENIGPGICTRPGRGTRFNVFIAQLVAKQVAPAWRNVPKKFAVNVGDVIDARNEGYEVHTYTPVAVFGGGLDPTLNQLSGNPIPAPECFALADDAFVLPGQNYLQVASQAGTMQFQCCIHPWMRATATVS